MWVEGNLYRKQYESPKTDITNIPFPRFPIPGFEHLTVYSTKFGGVDFLHISKVVKLIGTSYDEDFTLKASVLIYH